MLSVYRETCRLCKHHAYHIYIRRWFGVVPWLPAHRVQRRECGVLDCLPGIQEHQVKQAGGSGTKNLQWLRRCSSTQGGMIFALTHLSDCSECSHQNLAVLGYVCLCFCWFLVFCSCPFAVFTLCSVSVNVDIALLVKKKKRKKKRR